jgi:hypothetical protein
VETTADGAALAPLPFRGITVDGEVMDANLLTIGTVGSGKTMRSILPMVLSLLGSTDRSVCIVNAKGPYLTRIIAAAASRLRPGTPVQILNFRDPERSLAWNPLSRAATADDAFRVASTICHNSDAGSRVDSPFWVDSSTELLTGLVQAPSIKTLADVWAVSRLSVSEFGRFADRHSHLPQLSRFADYVKTGSHNAETIFQDLAMRLAKMGILDDRVRAVTCSDSEFRFDDFVSKGGIVVLECAESDADLLRPLMNLFVSELFETAIVSADTGADGRLSKPIAFVCDEFASAVGRIPKMETRINTLRSRGFSIIAATQSLEQLDFVYGPAFKPIMAGFSSLITIGSLSDFDREYISRRSGTITVQLWNRTEELDPHQGEFVAKSRTESLVGRPLLLPSDLVQDEHPVFGPLSVVSLAKRRPFLAHLTHAVSIPFLERAIAEASASTSALDHRRQKPLKSSPLRSAPLDRRESWMAEPSADPVTSALTTGMDTPHGLRKAIDWDGATSSARTFWEQVEAQSTRGTVFYLATEIVKRKATLTEYFMAFIYSGSSDIAAVFHYMEYLRRKKAGNELKRVVVGSISKADYEQPVKPPPLVSVPPPPRPPSRGKKRSSW